MIIELYNLNKYNELSITRKLDDFLLLFRGMSLYQQKTKSYQKYRPVFSAVYNYDVLCFTCADM